MDLETPSTKTPEKEEMESHPNLFPEGSYTNMGNFTKDGFKTLMEAIRHANALPTEGDYSYYNVHEPFRKIMKSEANHILTMINNILKHNGIKDNIKTSILDHKTELLIEGNDTILEKAANIIDEMDGIKKTGIDAIELQTVSGHLPINGSWNKTVNKAKFSVSSPQNSNNHLDSSDSPIRLLAAKNIVRPQKFFKDKIYNSNSYPWEPKIKEKPNSLKPLAIFLEETERGEEFSHPYELELIKFTPSEEQLVSDEVKPVYPKPLADTKLTEVTTLKDLEIVVEDLRRYKVIAVDLEHHSYRTFMGITCLMQISTGDTDYIIDTLALRDSLYLLNEIFTKPSILKVFHGAESDVLWLQRDLALYVVNMFDTHQAAKLLEYSGLSLAALLERFCKFKPNKHFQLADWRMRPLPDVLKQYAREDTHYLIYIYQMLKNELLKKAGGTDRLLSTVYQRSAEICMSRYFKPRWTEESHLDFYRKCKRMFDNRQMFALKELYRWRDQKAREEDESMGYVLPNHMLLQISEALPREMQGILACCNPIPPLVRSNLLELHEIILKARDKPVEQAILHEENRSRGSTLQFQKINVDSPLYCPHDLTKSGDFRDDLPTLLGDKNSDQTTCMETLLKKCDIERTESIYSVFMEGQKKVLVNHLKKIYLTPFERYQFVKPFIQDEEKKRMEKEENTNVELNIERVQPSTSSLPDIIELEDDIDKISHNLEDLVEERKTEEERLASIRAHFVLLSKKTEDDEEVIKKREEELYKKATKMVNKHNQSLVEMGGSEKRKREDNSEDPLLYEHKNVEHRFLNPAPYQTSENYTPLGQKRRKIEDSNAREEAGTPLNQILKKKKGKGKSKAGQQRPKSQKKNIHKGQNKPEVNIKTEKGQESWATSTITSQQKCDTSSNNKFNQNKKRKRNDAGDFEAFDYSSVDFRQFQGGASEVNQGKNIKSKFKNMGKPKNFNKAFNKSGMFKNSGMKR